MKDPLTGRHVDWNPSPQKWIDGSVHNDLPMTRLAELFNVNHFIVSQVNPHVVPFLAKDDNTTLARDNYSESNGPDWLHMLTRLAKDEALHRLHLFAELGIFPTLATKACSVLSQKYSGDITIFPEISYTDFPRMLANPTTAFMQSACLAGERATWPKLSRVENHCTLELALDAAVQRLCAHVVFSPSAVNLRRLCTTGRGRGMQRRVSNSNGLYTPLPFSRLRALADSSCSTFTSHAPAIIHPTTYDRHCGARDRAPATCCATYAVTAGGLLLVRRGHSTLAFGVDGVIWR